MVGWNSKGAAVSARAIHSSSNVTRGISATLERGPYSMGHTCVGLTSSADRETVDSSNIDFAMCCEWGYLGVFEKGSRKWRASGNLQDSCSQTDTLQIVVNDGDGAIEYFKNRRRVYTSQRTPQYPLHADAEVYFGRLGEVVWIERIPSPPPSPLSLIHISEPTRPY